MLKGTCQTLCAICISIAAYSQSSQDETKFSNDVGFNTNIILQGVFNSTSAPFSMMYKRYTSETKAWRYGLTGSFSSTKPLEMSDSSNTSFVYNTNVSVAISVGRELQKVISNKWIWFLGGDLVPSYSTNISDDYVPADTKIGTSSFSNYGIAARPFVGLRFNITRRLYLSTEFSATLAYKHFGAHQENFVSGRAVDQSTAQFSFAFNPATSIFVFYRF